MPRPRLDPTVTAAGGPRREPATACPLNELTVGRSSTPGRGRPPVVHQDAMTTTTTRGVAMQAWVVHRPAAIDDGPLARVRRADPEPGPGEVRIRVSVCGVCRTDLHLAEGDLAPHAPDVVPGHEIVGVVDALGAGADRFAIGERVGIAWLRHTCGTCRFCRRG